MSIRKLSRPLATLGVLGLLLATAAAPAASGPGTVRAQQPATDNTVTRIEVAPNGSARWTVRVRTRLDTESRVEEFRAFRARLRNDTASHLDRFRTRMRNVVANAANATGREMRAVDFAVSTDVQEVPRRWGIVSYRFTWTAFAARTNGSLAVGDVFRGGFFLAANDTLAVEPPAGYSVERVDPGPTDREDGTLVWTGRENFADRRPRVAFARAADATGSAPATTASTPGGAGGDGDGGSGVLVVLAASLLLGVVVAGTTLLRRRREDAASGGSAPEAGVPGPDDPGAGADIMTDEERVVDRLDAAGGRMRQADVADAFDWSPSKTSRVVGRLVEDGTVEKVRMGRENLIELADRDE